MSCLSQRLSFSIGFSQKVFLSSKTRFSQYQADTNRAVRARLKSVLDRKTEKQARLWHSRSNHNRISAGSLISCKNSVPPGAVRMCELKPPKLTLASISIWERGT